MFQLAVLVLTLANLIGLLVDLLVPLPEETSVLIHKLDTAICVVLLTDFFIRLRHASDKLAFLKWGWIDLIASIPDLDILRWGRLVRVLRVIRVLRAVRFSHRAFELLTRRRAETSAVSLGLAFFLLISFASIAILTCERSETGSIRTAGDALWWCLTTISTVGYGDTYPVTPEGRVIGVVVMMGGVGLFGALSGLLASVFTGWKKENDNEMREILARLDQLRSEVESLRARLEANHRILD